jgi:hypothetical protein
MAQLGFVILYTRDVAKKMAFYERAFGLQKGRLAPQEEYGEMHGDVPLQFVQEDFARAYVPDFVANRPERPAGGLPARDRCGLHLGRATREAAVGPDGRLRARRRGCARRALFDRKPA